MERAPKSPKLSPNELEIMSALWDLKQATSRQILARLNHIPALTTLLTYLTRLQAKGYVRREDGERGYVYTPAVPRRNVAGRLLDQVMAQFEGRLSNLVSHFVRRHRISPEERQRLRDVLDDLEEPKP